ncbi:N-acetylglucosamine kinase [Candidatus Solirubrobacter pratensis]|uniref:N-acetylglucosamine kinase n=1 Tax=Candidatus Solirubrobacter pratensis TaxID=1298857 RepID=UPI000412E540|nr:BadF/BadG/BcrA/BcrD ATPase family protein [Candidatus Solirubrobacter pratensis]
MTGLLLAVDGGNAKTDLAVLSAEGEVLAFVRGPGSSPHEHGVEGALDRIEALLGEALAVAGLDGGARPEIAIADLRLAGVDFPREVTVARERIERRGWARVVEVGNDTFALLRAGTDRGWGVAVVCGAGINCVGVGPDGRRAWFPALGEITGDWGGGYDLGKAAISAAARSEDGRGPRTSLERRVAAHFGAGSLLALAEAVHGGELRRRRFVELAPIVLAEAASDRVAAQLVDRLAAEIVALVRVALERIGPLGEPAEVLLGGGILRARDPLLLGAVNAGLAVLGVPLVTSVVDAPPVVGAALLALDRLGAPASARERLRRELQPDDRLAEVFHG